MAFLVCAFCAEGAHAAAVTYQTLVQQSNDVHGIGGISAVAASADGRYAYAAGTSDNAIAVFSRDAAGNLFYKSMRQNGGAQLPGDTGPVSGLQQPVGLALDAVGPWLYSVSIADGSVAAFVRDGQGDLQFRQHLHPAGLAHASAIGISGDGASVYVTGRDAGGNPLIAAFASTSTGLDTVATYPGDTSAHGGLTGLNAAAGMAVTHDGTSVYVNGTQGIASYARDPATGQLTLIDILAKPDLGGGNIATGHMAISPDDRYVYAADGQGLIVLEREAATGGLSVAATLADGRTDALGRTVAGLAGAYSVALSPEGSLLYVGSTIDSALAVFRRGAVAGGLTTDQVLTDGLNGVAGLGFPIDLAAGPEGSSLYSAANQASQIGIFSVGAADIGVSVAADRSRVNPGEPVVFTITVTENDAPAAPAATGVTVSDDLPVGLAYGTATPSQGSCTHQAAQLTCLLGDLPAAGSATVVLTAMVGAGSQFVNTASAAGDQRDPQPDDNAASVTVISNTPPVAADDSAVANPGGVVTIDVLANDSDADGDTLTISAFDSSTANGGSIAQSGTALAYTAAAQYRGSDGFHYTVTDGRGGQATADVHVTVNRPPTAADDTATTTRDTAVTIYVTANDSDSDGQAISVRSADVRSTAGGTVAVNSDGTIEYTPPGGYTGSDAFTYTIADSHGATATATVSVTVQLPAPVRPAGTGTQGGNGNGGPAGGGGGAFDLMSLLFGAMFVVMRNANRRRPETPACRV